MHQVFLYISSLFLHDSDVKLPTFTLRRAKTSDDEILFIFLNLDMGHFFYYVIQLYFGGGLINQCGLRSKETSVFAWFHLISIFYTMKFFSLSPDLQVSVFLIIYR